MRSLYDIPAPAKLNLFLHVTGRRSDGYHLLQSLFMLIDWCDTLHFDRRDDGRLSREDLGWSLPEDDLSLRAARALQRASGCRHGVHIGLHKSVPAQAGMGGGSSDAASTLLALNRLWGLDWPLARLLEIALPLGADVPFFLCGKHAWVEGIGEKISPLSLPEARFLVVKPEAGLDTGKIFCDPQLKRDTDPAILAGFAADARAGKPDFNELWLKGRNDLQTVAQKWCPEMNEALNWLNSLGLCGRMTGSGSAVFAQLPQDIDIGSAPAKCQSRVCSNLDAHPLADWAPSEGYRWAA